MKKSKKGLILGILVAVLVVGIAIPALAATVRQINASYSGIKIVLDGKQVTLTDGVEPFTVSGTTYLPLRAISSALGLDVDWDASTQTVKLTTPGKTPSAETGTYSRTNPAPIGTAQTIHVEDSVSGDYTATITVTEVIRGDKAWEMLEEENMFNSAAPDGMEYVLAKVKVTVDKTEKERSVDFSTPYFTCFSSNNKEYTKSSFAVTPSPLSGSIYAGGTSEGYIDFLVDKSDTAPKIVYGIDYAGRGGIWFKLN